MEGCNRALNALFRSLHQRSVWITPRICGIDQLILGVAFVQLIRSLGVAKGEAEVGFYVGIIVSKPVHPNANLVSITDTLTLSNPYSSPPKHAQSCTGVGSRTISAENLSF